MTNIRPILIALLVLAMMIVPVLILGQSEETPPIDMREGQAPCLQRLAGGVPGKFLEDDADGNGVVSRSEFSGPDDHFDRLDLNGDGIIEESEACQDLPGLLHRNVKDRQLD